MIDWETSMDIIQLYKTTGSIRQVAKLTGHARETITAIVQGRHCPKGGKRARQSMLTPHQDYIQERWQAGLSARLIYQELERLGFSGGYHTVQRYVKTLKAKDTRDQSLTVRFETLPGQQAQMDWGHCGQWIDESGQLQKLYVFVCVLSYSRVIYIQFTRDMRLATLVDCHQSCFDYFGGVPQEILYDNMKQVRLSPNKLNPAFEDFARYCGFSIRCHRAYRARTKGKVERAVKYVKQNFLPVTTFDSLTEANAKATHWMNYTANCRVHGTTQKIPFEQLVQEPLQQCHEWSAFTLRQVTHRQASKEGHVRFQGSHYSVSPKMAGHRVDVELFDDMIRITCPELMMTVEHPVAKQKGASIIDQDHLMAMVEQTTQQPVMPADVLRYVQDVEVRDLSVYQEVAL